MHEYSRTDTLLASVVILRKKLFFLACRLLYLNIGPISVMVIPSLSCLCGPEDFQWTIKFCCIYLCRICFLNGLLTTFFNAYDVRACLHKENVCICVCVCARACVRVCVRSCARVRSYMCAYVRLLLNVHRVNYIQSLYSSCSQVFAHPPQKKKKKSRPRHHCQCHSKLYL